MTTKILARGALLATALLLAGAIAPAVASAQVTVTGARPQCGAEGDPVLIEGSGFNSATTLAVEFGGVAARTLARHDDAHLVAFVPAGAAVGSNAITVNGTGGASFEVVAAGSPVVYAVTPRTVPQGGRCLVVGRRLAGATVDVGGTPGLNVRAGRRALVFQVDPATSTGPQPLTITNAAGSSCALTIDVVAGGGAPAITAIDPNPGFAGGRVKITGTDLGFGLQRIEWSDGTNPPFSAPGVFNGYDVGHSFVPLRAANGTYAVTVHAAGGDATLRGYVVGAAPAPRIAELIPDNGPPHSLFRVAGASFLAPGSRPEITLDGSRVPILGFFVDPRGRENLVTGVPRAATAGVKPVIVTRSGMASNSVDFTVR